MSWTKIDLDGNLDWDLYATVNDPQNQAEIEYLSRNSVD